MRASESKSGINFTFELKRLEPFSSSHIKLDTLWETAEGLSKSGKKLPGLAVGSLLIKGTKQIRLKA